MSNEQIHWLTQRGKTVKPKDTENTVLELSNSERVRQWLLTGKEQFLSNAHKCLFKTARKREKKT